MRSFTWSMACCLCLVASSQALAAEQAAVALRGSIYPGACSIGLDNQGRFDFGTISAGDLNPNAMTLLEPQETTLRIDCAAARQAIVRLVDEQAESSVALPIPSYEGVTFNYPTASFGLGTSGGNKIGAYMVELKKESFTEQGVAIPLVYVGLFGGGGSDTWLPVTSNARFFDSTRLYAFGHDNIEPVRAIVGTLRVNPAIAHNQGLAFEDEVRLDGRSVLELIYE